MRLSVREELLAQAIGREALKYMDRENLAQEADSEAIKILQEIQTVLDDDALDDPECFDRIERIVTAFHRHGIPTLRHDFG